MKVIYKDIVDRLKAKVPELRWIDLDFNQLESVERPPVAFPAALISIEVTNASDVTDYTQDCEALLSIRLAFDNLGQTAASTPQPYLDNALNPYNVAGKVYSALQGWHTAHFDPISRLRQRPEQSRHNLFIYRVDFQIRFEDTTKKSED